MTKKLLGKSFILLWLSETAFDVGAALLAFAMGVWVYEESGSVQAFSYAILFSTIPAILCTPFTGAIADRLDRRFVIAGCDIAGAIIAAIVALLLFNDKLIVEHLYIAGALGSVINAFRSPSYQAAVAQIVPKDHLTQANGLMSSSAGILQICGPLLSGYLMAFMGLAGIIVIDLVMSVAGMLIVFAAISSASHAIRGGKSEKPFKLFDEVKDSISRVKAYFRSNTLMLSLAAYMLIQEALLVLVSTLITPMVLADNTSDVLGIVMTVGALGAVGGALILAGFNMKKNLMLYVLISDAALALCVILAGFGDSVYVWSVAAFGAFVAGGVSEGCATALWMRKAPKESQGSIFAAVGASNLIVLTIVLLIGSALADNVLEPLMVEGTELASTFGSWVGVGKGRGIALMFVFVGALFFIISMLAIAHPKLRKLDELVEDQGHPEDEEEENQALDDIESQRLNERAQLDT